MTKKTTIKLICVIGCLTICFLFFPDAALAGPGGKIAEAAFRSFWGQILLGILTVVLAPLLIYFYIRERLAVKRTLADLKKLSKARSEFDWLKAKERISDVFYRVHSAWRHEDMQQASEWMTDWYWQNQQMAFLDYWEQHGLVNHCRVKKIKSIKPLFVRYKADNEELAESRLVVLISAEMEDYLAERETGQVIEGKKGFAEVDTLWTFVHENGQWLVSNIEERDQWYCYAKLVNEVPIEIVQAEDVPVK